MLGLIGCGMMGSALVEGIVEKGLSKPGDIFIYDIDEKKTNALSHKLKVKAAIDLDFLCRKAKMIFLAVKPQDMKALLLNLKAFLKSHHLLISIAAGLNIDFFEELLGKLKIIRVMPNAPCVVGEGMSVVTKSDSVSREEEEEVLKLMGALGKVIVLPEKYMDVVTGLSGSGPAYVFLFIEALADGGVEMGLSRDVALLLAAQTVLGAAKMCLETGDHPSALKNRITSPGGTTSAGLLALEEGAVRASVIKAIVEATRRSKALGN